METLTQSNGSVLYRQGRQSFFLVLVKEDSLAEDSDLKTEADLIKRCEQATNRLINIEACIDDQRMEHLENYRVRSEVFDLVFPKDNVYSVRPGLTRSVCDGYWLFIKPLQAGKHSIFFKGETSLEEPYTTKSVKGQYDSQPDLEEHGHKVNIQTRSFL